MSWLQDVGTGIRSFFGSGQQGTTDTQTKGFSQSNFWADPRLQANLGSILDFSNVGGSAFQDAMSRISGVSPYVGAAASGLEGAPGIAQPGIAAAGQIAQSGTMPAFANFYPAATQMQVGATTDWLRQQNAFQDSATRARMAQNGALTGSQGNNALAINEMLRSPGQTKTTADIYTNAFNSALQGAQGSVGAQNQAANNLTGAMSGTGNVYSNLGNLGIGTSQYGLSAAGAPFQWANVQSTLAPYLQAAGSNTQGTSNQQTTQQNLPSMAGVLSGVGSLFAGGFDRGGRVKAYAVGGAVDGDEDDAHHKQFTDKITHAFHAFHKLRKHAASGGKMDDGHVRHFEFGGGEGIAGSLLAGADAGGIGGDMTPQGGSGFADRLKAFAEQQKKQDEQPLQKMSGDAQAAALAQMLGAMTPQYKGYHSGGDVEPYVHHFALGGSGNPNEPDETMAVWDTTERRAVDPYTRAYMGRPPQPSDWADAPQPPPRPEMRPETRVAGESASFGDKLKSFLGLPQDYYQRGVFNPNDGRMTGGQRLAFALSGVGEGNPAEKFGNNIKALDSQALAWREQELRTAAQLGHMPNGEETLQGKLNPAMIKAQEAHSEEAQKRINQQDAAYKARLEYWKAQQEFQRKLAIARMTGFPAAAIEELDAFVRSMPPPPLGYEDDVTTTYKWAPGTGVVPVPKKTP